MKPVLASWPGPVTWLLPARAGVSRRLRGSHDQLAVRVTAHPLASRLCRAFHGPVVSTSANLAGRDPARSAAAVSRQLGGRTVDYLLDGPLGRQPRPTPIFDAVSGRQLRF